MPSSTVTPQCYEVAYVSEHKEDFVYGAAVSTGPSVTDPDIASRLNVSFKTPRIEIRLLQDCLIDFESMIVTDAGNEPLLWPRYLVNDKVVTSAVDKPPEPVGPGAGRWALGFNRGWRNYYHWMCQALPTIRSYLQAGIHPSRILLPAELDAVRLQSLAAIGLKGEEATMVQPRQRVRVDELLISTLLSGNGVFLPSRLVALAFDDVAKALYQLPHHASTRLYVSRSDSVNRPMHNERELMAAMTDLGFQCICAGELTLAQQLNAFRTARFIVAPHGAGLANLGFIANTCQVYELMPQHYVNKCFKVLTILQQAPYCVDAFQSDPVGSGGNHMTGWTADIPAILRHVARATSV